MLEHGSGGSSLQHRRTNYPTNPLFLISHYSSQILHSYEFQAKDYPRVLALFRGIVAAGGAAAQGRLTTQALMDFVFLDELKQVPLNDKEGEPAFMKNHMANEDLKVMR